MVDSGFCERPEEAARKDDAKPTALSVSAALAMAKTSLEQCVVTLVGEVSELSNKAGYKAVYFTVKDESSSLPCMMWMNRFNAAGVRVEVGSLVELTGRFTLYAAKGRMNFDVFALKLAGEGDLRLKVANLARKLEAEGLMDPARKRPIPRYATSIGLVTSPRGAAVHDVLRTLRRRFPLAQVKLAGVPVEGAQAPRLLAEALQQVSATGVEVVLLVRGGGSFEDLMPFNDEQLARAIAANPVPVVTGIGHEPDTSIADMVADLRASTPTGAAEAISPKKENLNQGFANAQVRLERSVVHALEMEASRLALLEQRPLLADPQALLAQEWLAIDACNERITRAIPRNIERDRGMLESWERGLVNAGGYLGASQAKGLDSLALRMAHAGQDAVKRFDSELRLAASRLNDLSPLAIISRGYAIARDERGAVVRRVGEVAEGDRLKVRVSDGEIPCVVGE